MRTNNHFLAKNQTHLDNWMEGPAPMNWLTCHDENAFRWWTTINFETSNRAVLSLLLGCKMPKCVLSWCPFFCDFTPTPQHKWMVEDPNNIEMKCHDWLKLLSGDEWRSILRHWTLGLSCLCCQKLKKFHRKSDWTQTFWVKTRIQFSIKEQSRVFKNS